MKDDFLEARNRAEDILLGGLGFGEDASIIQIERSENGFKGSGKWSDGEEFAFESEDELEELELWALNILLGGGATNGKGS